MKTKRILVATLAGATATGAVVGTIALKENGFNPLLATGNTSSYSCASIHYGMDDESQNGYLATYGTSYTEAKSPYTELGYVNGITLESVAISGASVSWLDNGTKYKANKITYTSDKVHGLKLGTSSADTTLTYTFQENIIGCVVYAVGWNDSGITISVNGSTPKDVDKNSSVSGTFADKEITYTPYSFSFSSTNELTIETTKRLFIGDIALKVAV